MESPVGEGLAVFIGSVTVMLSLLVKVIGEPDQIVKNFRRRSTNGLSLPYYVLGFLAYASWITHGIIRHDLVVIVSQSLGVVTTGLILVQFFLYRERT